MTRLARRPARRRISIPSLRDPRTRRIAITAGVLIAVVWAVALTFVALRGSKGARRSPTQRTAAPLSARSAPAHDAPHALWLFGFDTLRLDPREPTRVEHLGFAAFGDVAGVPGRVVLYDAGTGRVGALDASTNRIVDQTTIGSHDVDVDARPLLAPAGDDVWLVVAPGAVARHRLGASGGDPTLTLPVPAGSRATATRVATNRDASTVWAVADVVGASGARDVIAYEIDPRRDTIEATRPLGALDVVTLVALGDGVAVLTPDRVVTVPDAPSGAVVTSSPVTVAFHDAVAVGSDLWLLDEQARVVRFTPPTGRFAPPVPLPSAVRPLGAGARVVVSGTTVWALLPGPAGQPFHAVLAALDTRARRSTFAIGLPDQLAVGAIAVS